MADKMKAMKMKAVKEAVEAAGYTTEDMDQLVHDAASEIASAVNNDGMEEQVKFLLENQWSAEDILGRLKIQAEEGR